VKRLAPGTPSAAKGFLPSREMHRRSLVGVVSVLLPLLGLVAALVLAPTVAVRAQEQEPEVTLPTCGIRYPGGYDPNTVGVVEGRVARIVRPERGPVSFRLEAPGDAYTVHAAPAWFWEQRKIRIENGDLVRVKGSKTMGADGNLYLVAQEISAAGAENPEVLRDARGKPLWSGCGPGGCDRRGQR